jgi:hypothetical protein
LSFTRSFNAGFFTPRLYQKHWATGRYSGRVRQMLRYDLHGSLGPQQAAFFGSRAEPQEFTLSGSAGVLVEWSLTGNNLFGAGYDFARTALTTGAYRSHSFQIFWQGRF